MEAAMHVQDNESQIETLLSRDEVFFMTKSKEEVVGNLMQLIEYTKQSRATIIKEKTMSGKKRTAQEAASGEPEVDVIASAQSLRKIIPKQIKSQLVWKKTCKERNAIWKYQGVCLSPEVFQSLMKCDTHFKRKKMSVADLYDVLECDWLSKSVKNCHLTLSGDVTVAWDAKTHEFTFSGKYGK